MKKRILICLALLFAPVHAVRADPVTSFVLTAAAGTAFEAAAVFAIQVLEKVVISFAFGKISSLLFGKKGGSTTPSAQTIMVRSTTAAREIVYGEVRKSGVLLHQASSGVNNKYLWYVLAMAGHQCEDITDVWLGTEKILDANINPSTGAVTQSPFTGKVNIWRYLGTDADTVQSDWDSAFSAVTSNHRGRGIAKLIVRIERDNDAFPQGAPDAIFALVKGKRVYDPRLDSTNGGSGSHRLNDATTWEYSDNSALCAADYITGGSIVFDVTTPNNRLGMRSSKINWDYLTTAANKCDELVDIPGSATEKRYRCAAVLSCADTHETNLDVLLTAMSGNRVYTAGAYRIFAGQYDIPTETISDDDLKADGYKIVGATSATQRYNQVSGLYFDPAREYQEQSSKPRTDSAFETEDGKPILRTLDLKGVPSEYQAQRHCEISKQQSRNQITAELHCKLTALRLAPWDTFYLSLREMGWSSQVFRATAIEIDLGARLVKISASQESAAAYVDLEAGDYSTAGSAAGSRQLEAPDPITGLTTTGVPSGIRFELTLPAYIGPTTVAELYEYTSSTPFSSSTKVAEFQGSLYVLSRRDTTTRYYWVRLFDKRTKQASAEYPTSAAGVSGVAATVDYSDITQDAVTKTHDATASTVSITALNHTPNAILDSAVSITFTPPVSCDIEVFATGYYTYSGTPPFDEVEDGIWITGSSPPHNYTNPTPAGNKFPINRNRKMAVTAGVSTTVNWGMSKLASGDTLTVNYVELRINELRR
jgi:hypothetical protein